jgi:hypothetical protein
MTRPFRPTCTALLMVLSVLLPPSAVLAESMWAPFMDPTDGQFDTSEWMLNRRGVLPVPIIITEPAVGYGGGAALLWFHKSKADREKTEAGETLGFPPSVTAVFGLGTENGTWAAGGGHFASLRDDTIRIQGGGGYASMNLTFYSDDVPVDFNIVGGLVTADARFRIKQTPLFLGASYRFAAVSATRKGDPLTPLPLPPSLGDDIGGIGLVAQYDSRDNIFSPVTGQNLEVMGIFNAKGLGGGSNWQMLDYDLRSYHLLHPRFALGVRLGGGSTWGDVPFYALPYVNLRGIPALRYQGDSAGEGEFELTWRVWKRWSLVGFFGAGWTYSGAGTSDTDNGPFPAGGGGFRYLLARQAGMQVGIDVARGPEDTAFYIQVGGAW